MVSPPCARIRLVVGARNYQKAATTGQTGSVSSTVIQPPSARMPGRPGGVFIDWFGDQSVFVIDLALACCAVESEIAAPLDAPTRREVPEGARVVAVVSGTLTDTLAPLVARSLRQLPDAVVVAFGGCACLGGPYWDSYSVTKGVDQLVEVDACVPGCPPPPGALDEVLDAVRAGRPVGARPVTGAGASA